ncbi:MAG: cupin domain-containing protein [Acidimicrobiia bacterium]|nr:cupin domain-containing protein [Acidimicrobiia bacterium]
MRVLTRHLALTACLLAVVLTTNARGQSSARLGPQPEADPGVRPTRLIDRDEIRVSRIDLQPGARRSVHAHDDVEYHVWTPVEGTFEFTMGNDAPVTAKPGQAFFMKRGTRHGFRNIGNAPGAVFEIFVKKTATAASSDPAALVELLAALWPGW